MNKLIIPSFIAIIVGLTFYIENEYLNITNGYYGYIVLIAYILFQIISIIRKYKNKKKP